VCIQTERTHSVSNLFGEKMTLETLIQPYDSKKPKSNDRSLINMKVVADTKQLGKPFTNQLIEKFSYKINQSSFLKKAAEKCLY
jgi:hypothetical protein